MDSVKQVERGEDKHGKDDFHDVFEQVDPVDRFQFLGIEDEYYFCQFRSPPTTLRFG